MKIFAAIIALVAISGCDRINDSDYATRNRNGNIGTTKFIAELPNGCSVNEYKVFDGSDSVGSRWRGTYLYCPGAPTSNISYMHGKVEVHQSTILKAPSN